EINNPESVLYWCHRNGIPVFCLPSQRDGACATRCPGLVLDAIEDIRLVNSSRRCFARKHRHDSSGRRGREAPHLQCQPHAQRGQLCRVRHTGQEFDGSDSGGQARRGRSAGAKSGWTRGPVKVYSDATLAFPLIVAQTSLSGWLAGQTNDLLELLTDLAFIKRKVLPAQRAEHLGCNASDSRVKVTRSWRRRRPEPVRDWRRTGRLAASAPTILAAATGYEGRSTVQQQVGRPRRAGSWRRNGGLFSQCTAARAWAWTPAQELVRQGEVLNRTEEKLDHICEAVQKESQGHINSLSSHVRAASRTGSARRLGQESASSQRQPSTSRRGRQPGQGHGVSSTAEARRVAAQRQQPQTSYDRAFSENLGEMEHGMGRLKQLAMGLGGEIDRQNSQLERMSVKTGQDERQDGRAEHADEPHSLWQQGAAGG
uniref:t-SNARE coiled-coil homology domain-containing protein n=1 Tax=Macrostomum lignano TaxID=282301 RepID=A0A1I8FIJ9_9PLAT